MSQAGTVSDATAVRAAAPDSLSSRSLRLLTYVAPANTSWRPRVRYASHTRASALGGHTASIGLEKVLDKARSDKSPTEILAGLAESKYARWVQAPAALDPATQSMNHAVLRPGRPARSIVHLRHTHMKE